MAIEARVSERTRIARELHDTLLQSLQALLFQYQAARNLFAAGSERAMQVLDASLDRTEQAIAESRDAIRDIRSDMVAQNALPELLTRAGSELAQSQADEDVPTFGLTVEGERTNTHANHSGRDLSNRTRTVAKRLPAREGSSR